MKNLLKVIQEEYGRIVGEKLNADEKKEKEELDSKKDKTEKDEKKLDTLQHK
jgi:hypothetical protein